MYGIEYTPEGKHILAKALQADKSFSKLSAMALMLFVLLCGSCLASITMFYHEIKSIKLTVLFLCYPIVIAWIVSMLFYQIGRIVF
jgi:ferrous iron transport protein B